MLPPKNRRRPRRLLRRTTAIAALAAATLTACSSERDPTVGTLPEAAASQASDEAIEQGIPYREVDGTTLSMDACLPDESAEAAPAVLLVHGGGFTQGSRSDEGISSLCVWLAENGYAAFPVSYRLAPEHIYPAQPEDIGAAISFLRKDETSARFGIDPSRIGVLGSSAGAILALTAAVSGEGALDSGTRIAAAISLSGVADMTPSAATLGTPSPEAASTVLEYLGCESLAECDGEAASPITHVDGTDAPTLLVGSQDDLVPIEQSEAMAASLDAAGVPNDLIVAEGSSHGVALMNQTVRDAVLAFLGAHLSAR